MNIDNNLLKNWHKNWFKLGGGSIIVAFLLMLLLSCQSQNSPSITGISINDRHSEPTLLSNIDRQYQTWRMTPYRYGGNSLQGVDCSGLVMNFYQTKLHYNLPRTTTAQAKIGQTVTQLQAGDLLFFKTGAGKEGLHVGIYYKNGQFLHVSTSKGVQYSHINEPYWQSRFWQAKRII